MPRAKKSAKETVDQTLETVKEVTEQVKGAAKEAKNVVKKTVEKNPAVAEAMKETKDTVEKVAKETMEKVAKETKKTVTKTAKRAAAASKKVVKPKVKETYIQYFGKEVSQSEIVEKIIAVYNTDADKPAIKEIELYVKPEDNAVYYVINSSETGRIEL